MRFTLPGICLLFSVFAHAQNPVFSGISLKSHSSPTLDQNFTEYQVYEIDFDQIDQFVKQEGGKRSFGLQLGNEYNWQVEIIENDLRASYFLMRERRSDGDHYFPKEETVTYAGSLANDPESVVRLTIDQGLLFGYIESGKKTWYVEPLHYLIDGAATNQMVVYEKSAVIPHPGNMCAMLETEEHGHQITIPESTQRIAGECFVIRLALMSDGHMFPKYGSTPAIGNRLLGIINNVQGNFIDIFSDNFIFEITELYVITAASLDPWQQPTDVPSQMANFSGWAPNGFLFPHDLGQLWSNRQFQDGVLFGAGIQAGACAEPPNGYSLVIDYFFNADHLRRASAHVIGHNFNATHDNSSPATIMSAQFFNTANNWSEQSILEINAYTSTIVCLEKCEPTPVIPSFTSNISQLCSGSMVTFYDQSSGAPETWTWSFPGGTPATSTNANPTVTYNAPGSYSVSLTTTSPTTGTQTLTIPNFITVSPGNGSDFFYLQGFESGLNGWTINNPDGAVTWQLGFVPSARQGAGAVMFMDNAAYNGSNHRDALISPVFDFTGRDMISLEFDHAYAKRTLNNTDSLLIYVSTDGGITYPDKVFTGVETGITGNFATRPFLPEVFFPLTSEDWCFDGNYGSSCISVDLSDYAQAPSVRIKIENVAFYGNTLYLDNIRLISDCYVPVTPIADFTGTPTSGCAPLVVQYTNMSQNIPTNYIWSFPGGIPASSTLPNPQVVYPNTGSFDVTLTAINGAGSNTVTFQDYVVVDNFPFASFTYTLIGNAIHFTNTSSMNATTFLWSFGDGNFSTQENPIHVYDEEGFYQVSLTVSNACGSNTFFSGLLYLLPPEADFTAEPTDGCTPLTVQFTDESSETVVAWQWAFPGGTPSSSSEPNPEVTYNDPGTYDVTLIVFNPIGSDTLSMPNFLTVDEGPVAGFLLAVDENTVDLTNTSTNATSYQWSFGDGSTSTETDPSYSYPEDGEYLITLIASNDCGADTTFLPVVISTQPLADFSASPTAGCAPLLVDFTNLSSDNSETFLWEFPGGVPASSTAINPTVSYDVAGTYSVTLIATNSSGSDTLTLTDFISIDDIPDASFTTITTGLTVDFTNTTTNATSYFWDFGDGNNSTDVNPSYTYLLDGVYDVVLIATNDCGSDTLTQEVSAGAAPIAAIMGKNTEGCLPLQVEFFDESIGAVDSWSWTFPGGTPATSTAENPVVVYNTVGVFDVTLSVSNALGTSTITETGLVVVSDVPVAGFTTATNGLQVDFTNTSVYGDTFEWNFGDGNLSNQSDPGHLYDADGDYLVTLIVTNECGSDTATQMVSVLIAPVADFAVKNGEGCVPFEAELIDKSTGTIDTWFWEFPGGIPATSSDPSPVVIYNAAGVYDITLTVSNAAGSNSITQTGIVIVGDVPSADFDFNLNGLQAAFTNLSQDGLTYDWDFGDGEFSTDADPFHNYTMDGEYLVSLIVTNDCGADTSTQLLSIVTPPTAAFSVQNNFGCAPLEVLFSDESSENVTGWAWSFPGGTPATSTDQNPVIIYNTAGVYDIALTVTNAAGESSINVGAIVFVQDVPNADFTNVVTGTLAEFTNNSTDANSYEWQFGDGNTSDEDNPAYTYDMDGTYEVLLIATNDCGADTSTQIVIIETPPTAGFSAETTMGCVPLLVQFTDESSENATNWNWSFPGGDPLTSNEQNPLVTYNTAGTYDVTLEVFNGAGMSTVTQSALIVAGDVPEAEFTSTVNGSQVDFMSTISGATEILWDFGDGNMSMEENPSYTYLADGVYVVTLTATNDCGSVTLEETILISTQVPVASFGAGQTAGCIPFTVTFENLSTLNPESFEWQFPGGDPLTSTDENPTVTYNNAGQYDVTLIAFNANGSDTLTISSYINVEEEPTADFSSVTMGNVVDFTNLSINADTYLWAFGDGNLSMEENPSYSYNQIGTFNGSLIATNACGSDTVLFEIVINVVIPTANFTAELQEGCVPLTVQFFDASENEPTAWNWIFQGGTPATSTEQNPLVTYNTAGVFSVTLTVNNLAGNNTLAQSGFITVGDVPTAGFSYVSDMTQVNFTNTSTGATSYMWDFGDDSSSSSISPSHTYTESGIYTVVLEATNECGTTTFTQMIEVIVDNISQIGFLDRFEVYPNPNNGQFYLVLEGKDLPTQKLQATLFTVLGQVILEENLNITTNKFTKAFDIQHLAKGVYILRLGANNKFAYVKVIVD
ncbi:MAG: PKD domain-containing protein [Saprospiraceae bacterium]|nr:PKD domain-containing protein [Saprospiraceae bacterium]